MRLKDLHLLPRVADSWSYLYAEHCRVDQDGKAIQLIDKEGRTSVPCASLTLLMLGPGTRVTHEAVKTLADHGCLVAWTGEEGVRMYAFGTGETRSARNVLYQARIVSDAGERLKVVRRMYEMRFPEGLEPNLSLQQIRGKEGMRIRAAYALASRETGVAWGGRNYDRGQWGAASPVNRALSAANSCLYGVCHAAIVSAGFSPALGFVHTGKMLSFVYDIADLYKTDITIPVAFRAAAEGAEGIESRVRRACREAFRERRLLARIVPDIGKALGIGESASSGGDGPDDAPGGLWDPEQGVAAGGVNWADEQGEIVRPSEVADDGDGA